MYCARASYIDYHIRGDGNRDINLNIAPSWFSPSPLFVRSPGKNRKQYFTFTYLIIYQLSAFYEFRTYTYTLFNVYSVNPARISFIHYSHPPIDL